MGAHGATGEVADASEFWCYWRWPGSCFLPVREFIKDTRPKKQKNTYSIAKRHRAGPVQNEDLSRIT